MLATSKTPAECHHYFIQALQFLSAVLLTSHSWENKLLSTTNKANEGNVFSKYVYSDSEHTLPVLLSRIISRIS